MTRRRSVPFIHRWSRLIIGIIAVVGALLTAYLTITKLSGGEVACSTDAAQSASSCNSVLDSPYAYVFGLPLSLFGFLAYSGMATFALSPFFISPETNKVLRNKVEEWTWLFLLIGASSMAVFSSYLMYLLAFKLQSVCYYCIGSATFCLSLLVLTVIGRDWEDIGQIFFTFILTAVFTLVTVLAIYSNVDAPATASTGPQPIPKLTTAPTPPYGWEITTVSGESEIALAKHLTNKGWKMYGAFWCPHCFEQKLLFGKEAMKEINYIECDAQGKNPQVQKCVDAKIQGFPSWEYQGKVESGVQLLPELAKASNYTGPSNFKYLMR